MTKVIKLESIAGVPYTNFREMLGEAEYRALKKKEYHESYWPAFAEFVSENKAGFSYLESAKKIYDENEMWKGWNGVQLHEKLSDIYVQEGKITINDFIEGVNQHYPNCSKLRVVK